MTTISTSHLLRRCLTTASITLCVLTALTLLTACNSNDIYTAPGHLTIRSASLTFSAQAQQGHIEVVPTQGLNVQTSATWLVAQVTSDSTISVSVSHNGSLDGRTAVLALSSQAGTARISVTQQGAVWHVKGDSVYLVGDRATTLLIPVRSDYDYSVALPQWATGQQLADGYELTLGANTTGHCRRTPLTFSCERGECTVSVFQLGAADLAGAYSVTYGMPISATEQRDTTVTVRLVQSEADSTLFYAEGLSIIPSVRIPMTFDELTFTMAIAAGQPLGQVGAQGRYAFTALGSDYGAHVSTSVTYPAQVSVDPLTAEPIITFNDTEGFSYYDSEGLEQYTHITTLLTIGTVQNQATMSPDNFLGYADRIVAPVFRRTSD